MYQSLAMFNYRLTETQDTNKMDGINETTLKVGSDEHHLKKKQSISTNPKQTWKRYFQIFVAETIATAFLMCFGCMGGIAGFDGSTKPPPLQGAFVFGLTVCSLITTFGHISGAHMNPAVTVCFYMMGTIDAIQVPIYILAEVIGATMGVGFLIALTPKVILGDNPVCMTLPDPTVSAAQALALEYTITTLLLLVLLSTSDVRNADKQETVPIKFAFLIIAVSLFGGPYTGASMNPARSLAPAIWSNDWSYQWVYWVSPILSGVITPLFYQSCFPAD
ncbi:hypothetical protein O3M35_001440 [Rhynocoris fuscipes]|uniref:Aquaporin n=2 Tax=Rhynocoris fuscipes TaxID=488301 RepID=A0AAW1CRJ8_9HEMI